MTEELQPKSKVCTGKDEKTVEDFGEVDGRL